MVCYNGDIIKNNNKNESYAVRFTRKELNYNE